MWWTSTPSVQGIAGLAGAALLGAWFAGTAPASSPASPVAPAPAAPPPAPADGLDQALRGEVERLEERLDRLPEIAPGGRNPFVYAPAPPKPDPGELPAAEAPGEPIPVQRPEVLPSLIGIGGDAVNGDVRYTAVVVLDGRVALAAAGDTILNRYAVVAVTADAVALRDLTTGETTTLALQQ